MTEKQDEVAYLVRKFDEIAEGPPAQEPTKKRSLLKPAIIIITLIVILVIVVIYIKKNGMPAIKNPFAKKQDPNAPLAENPANPALIQPNSLTPAALQQTPPPN